MFTKSDLRQSFRACLCCLALATAAAQGEELRYRILEEAAHDSAVFTQGLELDGQTLVESSGLYGSSFIRRYQVADNTILAQNKLPRKHFAEGLTIVGQDLFLLTWRENLLYVLDKNTLKARAKIPYEGEGWGLCFDGSHFVMSNGSAQLFFRDRKHFKVKRTITVNEPAAGSPQATKTLSYLNELECAERAIWANVWQTSRIVKINPLSGRVMATLDLSELVSKNGGNFRSVLNGIAYDSERKAFWVTGKNWSRRYLIEILSENE